MYIIGIDPGLTGAIAALSGDSHKIEFIYDIKAVPLSSPKRVDVPELIELFKPLAGSVSLCLVERVGGLPGQSAPAAFTFGHATGVIDALAQCYFPGRHKTVPASRWKQDMKVRGKRGSLVHDGVRKASIGEVNKAIIAMADEMFPESRHLWRGPRGGIQVDRAEAALIALWGAKHGG